MSRLVSQTELRRGTVTQRSEEGKTYRPPYYPIFLDLRGRQCVVVGGGKEAQRKIEDLLLAGARVQVIAERLTNPLRKLAQEGHITWMQRDFQHGDLLGSFLAISEHGDRRTNESVWREAEELSVPVNVIDDVPHCTFIAPSMARRGDLTVAISTAGKAPALAVRLREEMEERLGSHHAKFLELAGRLRRSMAELHSDFEARRAIWYELVDSEVLELLRRGEETRALDRIAEITGIRLSP